MHLIKICLIINIFVDFRMMYSIVFILIAFAVQSIYGDLVHGKSIHLYLARSMVRDKPSGRLYM